MDENGGNVKKTEMDMNVSRQNIMRWRGERAEIFKLNEPPDAQRRKYRGSRSQLVGPLPTLSVP